ncbi:hypothetical protein [Mycolicibacterium sediminis]|uniref:Cellulose biosynthesis cyclic di-GMP-binding regulatory protein BcsB n=1 Tax=Mycolicibacterium sediminis TaxID=1286180 RepID=A0A7I7QQQ7_9MYCO|nr:hypothetical protein [Mycolicibacterium sediminis]BBY28615.1 hypothetical protein MSEDJ_27110 [Mycolicibacterium sediminis]
MTAAVTAAFRLLGSLVLCVAMASSSALPVAWSEPAPEPVVEAPAAGTTPAIAWRQLGLADRIQMLGYNLPTDIAVPVPQGVLPTVLTGQVGSVVDVGPGGRVDVLDVRGTFLGSIPLPVGPVTAPFAVDIAAAQVVGGIAGLSFLLRVDSSPTTACVPPPAVTLSELSTAFSGPTPNPRTVADFLPGYLDQIVIRVGPTPNEDQQQAALDLVAQLTKLYRPMPVRIDVDTSPDAVPPAESRRVIDVRGDGAPGMTVENPDTPEAVLAITGSGDDLKRQVALFADRRFELAQTTSVSVASSTDAQPKSTDTRTFGQLGMTGQVSVLGATTLFTGFDPGSFGVGKVGRARIHLLADYSPITGGEGSVLVRAGSTVIGAKALDDSGRLDLNMDVPSEAISSTVALAMEVRYTPREGCAPVFDRITFALNPQSTVSVTAGSNDQAGFPVLPMSFLPDFDVSVDSPDHLRFAAQAVNLLAQQTGAILRPHVTTLDQAVSDGDTGLLVVAGGDELRRVNLTPPLLPGQNDSFTTDGTPVTGVDGAGPLGVVQTFSENRRTILAVTGTGDWALVDRSFDFIRGLTGRWASLTGDVVATGGAGETVNLTVGADTQSMSDVDDPAAEAAVDGGSWRVEGLIAAGALVLLAVAVGLFVLIRRRGSSR